MNIKQRSLLMERNLVRMARLLNIGLGTGSDGISCACHDLLQQFREDLPEMYEQEFYTYGQMTDKQQRVRRGEK